MKKIILILSIAVLLLSSILLPAVSAGKTYTLDFSENDKTLAIMEAGDRVEFELNGERHTVILDTINQKSADVTAFLNLNTQNKPYYVTIGDTGNKQAAILKLDTNRDDVDDLYVKLYSISNMDNGSINNINNRKANILFIKPAGNDMSGNPAGNDKNKISYTWIILPFLIVIILIFVLVKLSRKFKQKNKGIAKD